MKNILKNQRKILWWSILLYFIIFSGICIWKYFQYGYNGLDLAIFNQVFYNSASGNLFHFTIHPQSYLGDHFTPIILLILPFYYIFQNPISLLVLQALILALTAWPIYLIAKKLLSKTYHLLPVFAWLFNPFVQNINLFEFHLLPFAVFFLFWTIYFYLEKRFGYFILFAFLSLLVREDVSLVIIMFSVLAIFEKRKLSWIIWPALIGSSWFILGLKITARFAPDGQYKFLYYYSWLGNNFKEIIINTFTHPIIVLKHITTWNNALFTLGLMLPFVCLLKLRYLLLGLLIYLQIIFGGSSNSTIALKLHYSALLLPALFTAFIFFLKDILKPNSVVKNKIKRFLIYEKPLTLIVIIAAILYSSLTLGPLPSVAKQLLWPSASNKNLTIKNEFIKSIPEKNSLATTYEFLTVLSSRPKIYSLHYAFIGKLQFSDTNYSLPKNTETLLIDFDDFITYSLQFPHIKSWQEYYKNGDNNIRKLIEENDFKVSKISDSLVVMERYNDLGINLYETEAFFNDIQYQKNIILDDKIKFLGWNSNNELPTFNSLPAVKHGAQNMVTNYLLPVTLFFQPIKKLDKNYQLKLTLKDSNNNILHQKYYPLAYGLYPTTEWQTDEVVKMNYWFLIPDSIKDLNYLAEIQLVDLKGYITLNGIRSVVPKITQENTLGKPIKLVE